MMNELRNEWMDKMNDMDDIIERETNGRTHRQNHELASERPSERAGDRMNE